MDMRVIDTMIHLQMCKVNMRGFSCNSKVNLMYEDDDAWTSAMASLLRLHPAKRFLYTAIHSPVNKSPYRLSRGRSIVMMGWL